MELRQLRYFVRIVELGSFSQAAAALDVVPSALSQQISRLESELSTRLLQRSSAGVQPTEAGLAFLHQARLALRHVDAAASAARSARLSGRSRRNVADDRRSARPAVAPRHARNVIPAYACISSRRCRVTCDMLTAPRLDLPSVSFRPGASLQHPATAEERLFVIGGDPCRACRPAAARGFPRSGRFPSCCRARPTTCVRCSIRRLRAPEWRRTSSPRSMASRS